MPRRGFSPVVFACGRLFFSALPRQGEAAGLVYLRGAGLARDIIC